LERQVGAKMKYPQAQWMPKEWPKTSLETHNF